MFIAIFVCIYSQIMLSTWSQTQKALTGLFRIHENDTRLNLKCQMAIQRSDIGLMIAAIYQTVVTDTGNM